MISGEAINITTATYNSLWYHHAVPLDNRKFNILILAFAQKPININGLSVIQCSLSSFLSVCKKKEEDKIVTFCRLNGDKNMMTVLS